MSLAILVFDCVGEIDSGFNSCESRKVPCKSCVAKRLELGSSSTEFGTRVLSIELDCSEKIGFSIEEGR